jgi:hypothetical protein
MGYDTAGEMEQYPGVSPLGVMACDFPALAVPVVVSALFLTHYGPLMPTGSYL